MQSGPGIASSLTLGLVLVGASLTGLAREETAVFQHEKPVAATAEFAPAAVVDWDLGSDQFSDPVTSMDLGSGVATPDSEGARGSFPGPVALAAKPRSANMPPKLPEPVEQAPEVLTPLEQAQQLARSGDISGALASLGPAVEQAASPEERINAFYMKGMLLLAEGDNEGAKDVFSTLISDYPKLPEPYNNLAAIHASEGDLETARALLEDLLKENPDYVVALENLGDVYTKLAADSYRRARELEPAQETVAMKLKLLDRLFEPTI